MGPRFNGVEDEGDWQVEPTEVRVASMGPRFNGVEDRPLQLVVIWIIGASMGPRFNGVEDVKPSGGLAGFSKLQWGHALMAWKTGSTKPSPLTTPSFNGATL